MICTSVIIRRAGQCRTVAPTSLGAKLLQLCRILHLDGCFFHQQSFSAFPYNYAPVSGREFYGDVNPF